MDIKEFKKRNKTLIEKGVITFNENNTHNWITIDRYYNDTFLCDKSELSTPRSQIRKMGYVLSCNGVGSYIKLK